MWICCPFHQGDAHLAKALLSWIKQLDGNLSHGALLVVDSGTDWGITSECLQIAASVFQRVEIITTEESWGSWPAGPNALFKCAAKFFEGRKIAPWFWLEPDAIPLMKSWLDVIQTAYFAAGKSFMGCLTPSLGIADTVNYLPGCSVYPWNAWSVMSRAWDECRAFDIATAKVTIPLAVHTEKIQHFWGRGFGEKHLAPTFVDKKTSESPINTFTLKSINPEAVVFHANKDGTLLKLLGYREPTLAGIAMDVVFPVCSNDARLMVKNLKWLGFLHNKKNTTAVLLIDALVANGVRIDLINAARAAFSDVLIHVYSSRASGWPHGPNCAFQEACYVMNSRSNSRSWLWYEADMVATAQDWLEVLSFEYVQAGRPFMGTIIECMGWHLQGTAIYPPNVQHYCRSLPRIKEAFDVALNPEIMPHRHRANHLMKHDMSPPSFASMPDLRAVDPGIVVYHPDKSGQLIDRLAEQMMK